MRTWRVVAVAGAIFAGLWGTQAVRADMPAPGGDYTNTALQNWSFFDTTGWKTDLGYAPLSFTNSSASDLGDGPGAVVVDSANVAWLQYRVVENDGRTNLTVNSGTFLAWFGQNWTGTNAGGTGPGVWGRLLEAGHYTEDASFGWFSLYTDPDGVNLYFSAQGNDGSEATFLTAPILWDTTNQFHLLALTYSATNSALYLDGALLTNGLPVSVLPPGAALTNGFLIGSDSTGLLQAHGIFDDVATYRYPLDADTISATFNYVSFFFYANPNNPANFLKTPPSNPTNSPNFQIISGAGALTNLGSVAGCVSNSNVWLTNVTAKLTGSGTNTHVTLAFDVAGGLSGLPYDVFANGVLPTNVQTAPWVWEGQVYSCYRYQITNLPPLSAFVRLGTPQDSDGDGLTDAYELLVSLTDPHNPRSGNDGIPDGWKVLWNLSTSGAVAGQDPDGDGLTNLQEYLWGSNPKVAEPFTIWVASPGGSGGLP